MALNTNGWDYVYTVDFKTLNELIKNDSTNRASLVDMNITDSLSNVMNGLTVKEFEVLNTSLPPYLETKMTLDGKYKGTSFTGVKLVIKINMSWLNKYSSSTSTPPNPTATELDVSVDDYGNIVLLDQPNFESAFKNYLNEKYTTAPTVAANTDRKYVKYYNFFAGLNKFHKEKDANGKDVAAWMNPTTQRFAIKTDSYKPLSNTTFFFSFSCMIDGHPNNYPSDVDLNAIPDKATSALIIERSVFGKYMVAPKIGKDILQKFDKSDGDVSFDKLGAYTMINKEKSKFRYADFITSQTYIGIVPIIDWFSSLFGGIGYPIYRGTVPEGNASININEDHINFRVKDAEYMYSLENWPKITQDYIITLKYDGTPKVLNAKTRLIDAGINYFHTDIINQIWHIAALRLRDKKKHEEKTKPKLIWYLPYFQEKIKELLKSTNKLLVKRIAEISETKQELEKQKAQDPDPKIESKLIKCNQRESQLQVLKNKNEDDLDNSVAPLNYEQTIGRSNIAVYNGGVPRVKVSMKKGQVKEVKEVKENRKVLNRAALDSNIKGHTPLKNRVFPILPNNG